MAVEEILNARIAELLHEAPALGSGNARRQCVSDTQRQRCSAWLTAAQNVVHLLCPDASSPYRRKADRIAGGEYGYIIHTAVGEMAAVLENLLADADAGLLASVAEKARAEVFDDFLDHAAAYLRDGRKNEAGAIAGVVLEDVIRRICRKVGIQDKDKKLDVLISELATGNVLSPVKAKRARAAAVVRNKATHAQWDEFDLPDVQAAINLTRELVQAKLDG